MSNKSRIKLANRAWRKATKNWGGFKKARRDFCRENAYITVFEVLCDTDDPMTQLDMDYQIAEELTEW